MNSHSISDQSKWFIRTNLGETRGPFTALQITELLANRKITVGTYISKTAAGPFKILTEFPEFSSPIGPPPLLLVNESKANYLQGKSLVVIACALTSILGLGMLLLAFPWSTPRAETKNPSPPNSLTQSRSDAEANSQNSRNNEGQSSDSQNSVASVGSNSSSSAKKPESPSKSLPTFEEVVSQTEKSVCLIQATSGSSGSGFLIDADKIMTNRHVIDGMMIDEIEILFPNNASLASRKLSAKVLYEDPKLDVAILKIPSVSTPPLTLGDDDTGRVRRGMDVVAIGSPGVQIVSGRTIENAVSRGLLSSETIIDGIKYYQASIALNPGNSGGPILDMSGTVVGMVTLKDTSVEGMAFAVPCYSLREIFQSLNVRSKDLEGINLERLNQEHDARVIVNRTTDLLVYDIERLGEMTENIFEGITEFNLEVDSAFAVAREIDWRKDHRGYASLESITTASIKKISASKHLNASVRLKIAELWGLSRELHGYVTSPRGSLNSLKNKLTEIQDKAIRLRSELNALLDFRQ